IPIDSADCADSKLAGADRQPVARAEQSVIDEAVVEPGTAIQTAEDRSAAADDDQAVPGRDARRIEPAGAFGARAEEVPAGGKSKRGNIPSPPERFEQQSGI